VKNTLNADGTNWHVTATAGGHGAGSAQTIITTLSPKTETVSRKKFFKTTDHRSVYTAFGATAPEALRRLAEGLEGEGIRYLDAVTVVPDWDALDDADSAFSAAAFVYDLQE